MTAGAEVTYANYNYLNTKITQFGVGPFFRYSLPIAGIFSAYTQVGAGYATEKHGISSSGFYGYIYPAIFMQVHKGFGLNFSTGKLSFRKVGDQTDFNFNYGLVPTVGVSFNFGGQQTAE